MRINQNPLKFKEELDLDEPTVRRTYEIESIAFRNLSTAKTRKNELQRQLRRLEILESNWEEVYKQAKRANNYCERIIEFAGLPKYPTNRELIRGIEEYDEYEMYRYQIEPMVINGKIYI